MQLQVVASMVEAKVVPKGCRQRPVLRPEFKLWLNMIHMQL